ncbi:tRNA-splicing ligase, RtcB [Kipferlia bialata]|uniref:3'-phosphate/5'-hydroxy nucleic acid ligase n=1 Tax=Kipferlia bialata TaxID=797122 RepID=A0A9K3CT16_9EUKA|nr:tRNA-splicing ligase, RtcB [Kipferlia bialata]|eukprot:g3199.t1
MGPTIEIKGERNTAIVYADEQLVEGECQKQIRSFIDHDAFATSKVRIMPDAHAGMGAVIGFTATLGELLVPSVVGVDIGCGVCAWKLGKGKIDFGVFDSHIRKTVPSGFGSRSACPNKKTVSSIYHSVRRSEDDTYEQFLEDMTVTCERIGYKMNKALKSMGTLGGGNHFIEIDESKETGDRYLCIHSGSRNFGLSVAMYHMAAAARYKGIQYFVDQSMSKHGKDTVPAHVKAYFAKDKEMRQQEAAAFASEEVGEAGTKRQILAAVRQLEDKNAGKFRSWVEQNAAMCPLEPGQGSDDYVFDMQVSQTFAQLNRRLMGMYLVDALPVPQGMEGEGEADGEGVRERETSPEAEEEEEETVIPIRCRAPDIESVHNYIDFTDKVVRKGAISARDGQPVIIPLNMADGTLIAVGKGNADWNCSAPHGAGRIMSRSKAFKTLDMGEYTSLMQKRGVFSTCVVEATLDEAPMAYKPADRVIEFVQDTIDITDHVMPIFNFKGMDDKWKRKSHQRPDKARDTAAKAAAAKQAATKEAATASALAGMSITPGATEGQDTEDTEDVVQPMRIQENRETRQGARDRKRRDGKRRRRGRGGAKPTGKDTSLT